MRVQRAGYRSSRAKVDDGNLLLDLSSALGSALAGLLGGGGSIDRPARSICRQTRGRHHDIAVSSA